ncbi:hypothetical protein C922_02261 [Plasmodium inui San Antonio 1]|uniref:Pv-fam-d protein n=1 Tax=Plasmodium inui San Antonio 1 TaxID=1237626 RepID=W7A7I7_9APIC|nr:hypothetical protein C922_02261 [Plasmodium inui San Antonio 1]EUD67555.1 hypothetical protein C922_02261 [Plasmodium inui San Antonio 1]
MLNIFITHLLLLIISIWTLERFNIVECTCHSVWEKKFKIQDKANADTNRTLTENQNKYHKAGDWSYSYSSVRWQSRTSYAEKRNARRFLNSDNGNTRYLPTFGHANYVILQDHNYPSYEHSYNYSRYRNWNGATRARIRRQNVGTRKRRKFKSANRRNFENISGQKFENPLRQHFESPYRLHFKEPNRRYLEGLPRRYIEGSGHHIFQRTNRLDVDYDDIKSFSNSDRNYEDIRYALIDDDDDEGSSSEEDNLSNYSFNDCLSRRCRIPYEYKRYSGHHKSYGRDDYSVYDDTYDTHTLGGTRYVISEHGSHNALEDDDGDDYDDLAFLDKHYTLPLKNRHDTYRSSEYVVNQGEGKDYESYNLATVPPRKRRSRNKSRIKHYIKKYNAEVVKLLPSLSTGSFVAGVVFSLFNYVAIPIICSTLSYIFSCFYIKELRKKMKKQKRIKRQYLMDT